MSFKESEFKYYSISYNNHQLFEAVISVSTDKNAVGEIRFVKNSAPVPTPDIIGTQIYVYYSISRFNDVINILREEKPLQLMADTDAKFGAILSSSEPVGEEEGV